MAEQQSSHYPDGLKVSPIQMPSTLLDVEGTSLIPRSDAKSGTVNPIAADPIPLPDPGKIRVIPQPIAADPIPLPGPEKINVIPVPITTPIIKGGHLDISSSLRGDVPAFNPIPLPDPTNIKNATGPKRIDFGGVDSPGRIHVNPITTMPIMKRTNQEKILTNVSSSVAPITQSSPITKTEPSRNLSGSAIAPIQQPAAVRMNMSPLQHSSPSRR
jgi:hypothetical protein